MRPSDCLSQRGVRDCGVLAGLADDNEQPQFHNQRVMTVAISCWMTAVLAKLKAKHDMFWAHMEGPVTFMCVDIQVSRNCLHVVMLL